MDKEKIMKAVTEILEAVGENPERAGLKETPRRVADMYAEMFSGLTEDPEKHLKFFEENPTVKRGMSAIYLFYPCASIILFRFSEKRITPINPALLHL